MPRRRRTGQVFQAERREVVQEHEAFEQEVEEDAEILELLVPELALVAPEAAVPAGGIASLRVLGNRILPIIILFVEN
jgi:hypothetical protein